MLATSNDQNESPPAPLTRRRPAKPEVTCPGKRATVEVMLAASGVMPVSIKTGKVMNEPPPANAFCSPAHKPAMKTSTMTMKEALEKKQIEAVQCAWLEVTLLCLLPTTRYWVRWNA